MQKKMTSPRRKLSKKRAICIVLACVLLVGTISAGLIAYASDINNTQQVSDYFYMQIYNSEDQVVSKYKITLTGEVSNISRKITSVSFSHESGDICETDYDIDGYTAAVTIIHPTEGYLARNFTLSTSGIFSGY